jgi:hypothetical protein
MPTKLISKLTVAILVLMVVSCKKITMSNQGVGNQGNITAPGYTETPAATPVSSKLMAYAVGNDQSSNPYYITLNGLNLNYNNTYNGFNTTGVVSLDKYTSTLLIQPEITGTYEAYTPNSYKTFTASGSSKNYVNAEPITVIEAGSVTYDYGSGTLSLPNSSQLVLPSYSFGMHTGSVSFWVLAAFTDPSTPDYATSLPCYSMADENGKRWFLNSYGMYLLYPWASDNSGFNIDFNPDANVVLRMPVPTNQSNIPDSIPAWNINNNNVWQQNGFAIRAGNYYEKKITQKGYWNFAVPINGVYTTFHLRSNTALGLPNIRYTIKDGVDEVAEGRTDANGDGIVFVPVNKNLTIDLINDHFVNVMKMQGLTFGSFNKASEITVTLPPSEDIVTLRGSIFDCNGAPIVSGYAGLRDAHPNNSLYTDEYLANITNGKFSSAQWSGNGFIDTLTIYNNSGENIFSQLITTSSWADTNYTYNASYYTCLNSTQLYCNYRIDSSSFSIEGNTNVTPPALYASAINATTTDKHFNLSSNGMGVQFDAWFIDNDFAYLYPANITVNGATVQMDASSGESEVTLYRNDVTAGGFMEGMFIIYYKDSNGIQHTIAGNFRIKIN